MSYRHYNWILLGGLSSAMLFVVGLSFFTGPIDGDLTRIGGLAEREFGWNSTQPALGPEYLFHIAHSLDEWTTDYDVVVLGDSFTLRPHTSWASLMHARTGRTIMFFHQNDFTPETILQSEAFRNHPPALFVYQSVERHTVRRLAAIELESETKVDLSLDSEPPQLELPQEVTDQPTNIEVHTVARRTRYASFRERVSDNIHIIKIQLNMHLLNASSQVVTLNLKTDACRPFTSNNNHEMLILRSVLETRRNWRSDWEPAAKGLTRLARAVESTGSTRFMALLFPDKLSVYADLVEDEHWAETSVIPWLASHQDMPRLDLVYKSELAVCSRDLYLPNNTHTGGTGSVLATETVLEYLSGGNEPDLTVTTQTLEGRSL